MTEPISRYAPGDWIAAVTQDAWLLAEATPDARVETCWLELRATKPDVEAHAAADVVLEELLQAKAGGSAGIALVYRMADATRVVVHGSAVAEITDAEGDVCVIRQEEGERTLTGGPIGVRLASSIDAVCDSAATLPIESGVVMASVVSYVDEMAARALKPVPQPAAEPASDEAEAYLDDFMEPADGRTQIVEASDLDWMSAPSEPTTTETAVLPAPVAAPEPLPEPSPELTQAAPLPEPAFVPPVTPPLPPPPPPLPQTMFGTTDQPLVTALRCPAGHLTPTESIHCRVCGAAVAPQEAVTVPRPCLGRLRLSNGEVYLLDRDAVFGRKPEIPPGRPGPRPNAIVLTDDRDVSRNHVEIRLDGWRVLALDLGSMNGTQLAGPNLAPRLLPPRTAQEIVPGSVLTLAPDVWIYFEEER